MKKPKTGLRILASFFEILLVIVFIIAGILTPTLGVADGLINGDTLATIVNEADLSDVFYELFKENAGEEGAKEFGTYLNSNFAKDVLKEYTSNASKFLKGEEYVNIDQEFVSQKYDEHIDEMNALIFENHPEARDDSEAQAEYKSQILEFFEMLPPINTLEEELNLSDSFTGIIAKVNTFKIVAVLFTLVIAAVIVFITRYKGNGFVWLAVALIIPMIISLIIGFADASTIADAGLAVPDALSGIATQVITNFTSAFRIAGLIYVVLFIASIVMKVVFAKKYKAQNPEQTADYSYNQQ